MNTEAEKEPGKPPLPQVGSVRVLAWRCLECNAMNLNKLSRTHETDCSRCAAKFLVNVNRQP